MKLIIGLGNPGDKYINTRHNVGFMVVEELLKKLAPVGKSRWKKIGKAETETSEIGDVVLAKPQTMMNASGFAVKKLTDFYHIKPADLWIVHDDLDLPLGKIKIRVGGGTAGHHGLESIVKHLGTTDFVRFRLGIGKPEGHGEWQKNTAKRKGIENYVLSEFHTGEQGKAREMIKKAVKAIEVALKDGLEKAMNRFNAK